MSNFNEAACGAPSGQHLVGFVTRNGSTSLTNSRGQLHIQDFSGNNSQSVENIYRSYLEKMMLKGSFGRNEVSIM